MNKQTKIKIMEEVLNNIEYSIKPKYYTIDEEYNLIKKEPSFLIEKIYDYYNQNIDTTSLEEYIKDDRQLRMKIRSYNLSKINEISDIKLIKMIYNKNVKSIELAMKMYQVDKELFYNTLDKFVNKFDKNMKMKYKYLKKLLKLSEDISKTELQKHQHLNYQKLVIMQFIHYILNSVLIGD